MHLKPNSSNFSKLDLREKPSNKQLNIISFYALIQILFLSLNLFVSSLKKKIQSMNITKEIDSHINNLMLLFIVCLEK